MMRQVFRARRARRATAAALVAAASGIAMLAPGDAAYGTTFTFATFYADMLDPTAWTPNGIPGAGDLMFIRRRAAGDTTNVDFTINSGSITVGGIQYDTGLARRVFNSVEGTTSTITLGGLPDRPLIQHTLTNGTLGFISAQTGFVANNDSGSVTLNTGTLNVVIAADGDIATNSSVNILFDANVSETGGPHAIRKTNAGTVIFAGNNSLGGSIEARQGSVVFDFSNHTGTKIASTGSLIFTGGSLIQNGNAAQDITQTVNGAYVNSGQSVLRVDVGTAGLMNSTLNVGDFHRSVGAYLNINYATNGTSVPRVTTTTANGPLGLIGAWLNVGNNDWAVNDGAGNVIAMPAASYATKNDLSTWATNDNITNATAAYGGGLSADLTIGSLRFSDTSLANIVNLNGKKLTIASGGILLAGNTVTTHTITSGILTSATDELLPIIGGGKTLTISSTIANNSVTPLVLTKNGSGTLLLSGANTFTGGIILNTGTINAMGIASAGSPSSLGADGLISMGGPNNVLLVGSTNFSGSMNFNRNFQFNEGVQTLQINAVTAGATISLGGSVAGTGGLTKGGSATSTLLIPGAKTYSGAVISNTGMISVDTIAPNGTPSSLGTGTLDARVILGNGAAGTLEFTGTAPVSTSERTLQIGNGSAGGSINLVMTQPVTLNWNGSMLFNSGQATFTTDAVNGIATANFAVGSLNVRPFRVDTPGTIVFNGNIGASTLIFGQLQKFGTGTLIMNAHGYAFGTVVSQGTLISNTNLTSNGSINAVGTTLISGLRIDAGAVARVSEKPTAADPAGTTVLPSVFISATGQLDLTNNALVEDYPENFGSPANTRRTLLATGYNGGSWNGNGINSSTAAAQSTSAHKTALGYAEATSVLPYSNGTASFAGQTLAQGNKALLIRYVYAGDANINGTVDLTDFTFLAANFNKASGAQWLDGDFNYDDKVDLTDFTYLASNFNQTLASSGAGSLGAAVPEPATLGLLACGLASVAMRRRRRCG